jgi:hypothetical protein
LPTCAGGPIVDDVLRGVFAVACVLMLAGPAGAEPARATRGKQIDAVHVGQRRVWSGQGGERVISAVATSRKGDAVAFATRGAEGAVALVVVLVGGDVDGHTMRFPVPSGARPTRRGKPTVTWMGKTRVAYGPAELAPTVIASWRLR